MGKVIGLSNSEHDRGVLWRTMVNLRECIKDGEQKPLNEVPSPEVFLEGIALDKTTYKQFLNEYTRQDAA